MQNKRLNNLSVPEIQAATKCILKITQSVEFPRELSDLRTNKQVNRKSRLLSLNPFIDDDGLIRVGGRLKHAPIENDTKYPIIVSPKCHVTILIICHEHQRLFHAGTQATLSSSREKY